MHKKELGALAWTARILGVLFVGFISIFSWDSLQGQPNISAALPAFLMALLPALLLAGGLALGFKWELLGGLAFLAWATWYWLRYPFQPIEAKLIMAGLPAMIGCVFLAASFWDNLTSGE